MKKKIQNVLLKTQNWIILKSHYQELNFLATILIFSHENFIVFKSKKIFLKIYFFIPLLPFFLHSITKI